MAYILLRWMISGTDSFLPRRALGLIVHAELCQEPVPQTWASGWFRAHGVSEDEMAGSLHGTKVGDPYHGFVLS